MEFFFNVKDRTDKAFGNVSRTNNALSERPYGKHNFKATLLKRQAMLLGGLQKLGLQLPHTFLHKTLLSPSGNPSKVKMCL